MLSINCLNCNFWSLKLYIKYKLIDDVVNDIQLTQNLSSVLRA